MCICMQLIFSGRTYKKQQLTKVVNFREAVDKNLFTSYYPVPLASLSWAPTLLPFLPPSWPRRESSPANPDCFRSELSPVP